MVLLSKIRAWLPFKPELWGEDASLCSYMFTLLSLVHMGVAYLARNSRPSDPTPAPPDSRLPSSADLCYELRKRSHTLGHQASCFVAVLVLGIMGTYYWFWGMADVHDQVAEQGAYSQRLFTFFYPGKLIAQLNFAFQSYDLIVTILIPELRSIIMIMHHFLAATVAAVIGFSSLVHAEVLGHYYSVYFLGVAEISTVPLAIHDALKFLPAHLTYYSKTLKTIDEICKPLFAILFLLFRFLYWPKVITGYWLMSLEIFLENKEYRAIISFYAVVSALLTILQFYWGYLVIRAVARNFVGVDIFKQKRS